MHLTANDSVSHRFQLELRYFNMAGLADEFSIAMTSLDSRNLQSLY